MRSRVLAFLAAFAVPALCVVHSQPAAANPLVSGGEHCVVNVATTDALNLREAPGTGSRVLARLPYASCGVILMDDCQQDWCPIETGHHRGWAHRHYLAAVSPEKYCVIGVARDDVLNLRAWPSAESRILTGLAPASCGIAFLPYARDGWQKVRAGGWEGWVNARYLTDH